MHTIGKNRLTIREIAEGWVIDARDADGGVHQLLGVYRSRQYAQRAMSEISRSLPIEIPGRAISIAGHKPESKSGKISP